MEQVEKIDNFEEEKIEIVEVFPPGGRGKFQKKIWDLFEKPASSPAARVIGVFSIFCIFVSTVILTLNTLPYFQNIDKKTETKAEGEGMPDDSKPKSDLTPDDMKPGGSYMPFAVIEACYMAWFTFEFVVRLIFCPSKVRHRWISRNNNRMFILRSFSEKIYQNYYELG